MNEGWATFWHYTLLNRLYDERPVDDGFMIELLTSHTNVVDQRGSTPRTTAASTRTRSASRCSPTSAASASTPTDEDRALVPGLAGSDWRKTLDFAMRNFKDESFIAQYLSPRLIREFRLFAVADHRAREHAQVDSIHNERGLPPRAQAAGPAVQPRPALPDIQIVSSTATATAR